MSQVTRLILDLDNPCNTKVTDADGNVLYIVYTEAGSKASTTRCLTRSTRSWHRSCGATTSRATRSRSATSRPCRSANGCIRASFLSWSECELCAREYNRFISRTFGGDVSFADDMGRKYKWKGNSSGMALQLHTDKDSYKEPIAGFEKPRRDPQSDAKNLSWTPAQLLLTPRALEIRDIVVIAFLFLERSHRTNEQSKSNLIKADVPVMQWVGAGTSGISYTGE